ncbi:MAG: glycosyltransferase family 1 protein [Chitinophagaceae bacterium]
MCQEFHFPEFFTPEQRIQRAIDNHRNLSRADTVFVSFRHVKDDLLRYFRLPSEKVTVLPLPLRHMWIFDVKEEDVSRAGYEQQYTFPGFFLYPAATWKHKNHAALIRAIAMLKKEHSFAVYLYCTGHITDYGRDELLPMAEAAGVADRIKFLGSVSNDQLYWLYKHAHCVIVPSLYEAGSFPVIEAIYLDTPVLCSDVTSLPDTIDMPDVVFNPEDPKAIAALMLRMSTDTYFYKRCKAHLGTRRSYLTDHEPNEVVIATYKRLLK